MGEDLTEKNERELHQALGWVTVAFSNLEAELAFGIWEMIDEKNWTKTAAITAGRRMLDLLDLYLALAKMQAPDAAAALTDIMSRLRSVNDRRNRYVHSIWTKEWGVELRVRYSARGKKGFQQEVEKSDPKAIRQVGDDAIELAEEINDINRQHVGRKKPSRPPPPPT